MAYWLRYGSVGSCLLSVIVTDLVEGIRSPDCAVRRGEQLIFSFLQVINQRQVR